MDSVGKSTASRPASLERNDPRGPAPQPAGPSCPPVHPQLRRLQTAPPGRSSAPHRSDLRRSRSDISETLGHDRRLVVVSNRVVDPDKPAAGGLAVALGEMMHDSAALWFGWSNKTTSDSAPAMVKTQPFGRTTLAQVDLSQEHHDGYYAGFSNSVLWPVFHDKVKWVDLNPAHFKAYKEVNRMMASQLAPMLKDNDVLWIHDYHLIPFAQELRKLGCKQRMGFFNHIPLPSPEVIKQIPQHRELMEALMSYDLIGMQSPKDVENLRLYAETEDVGRLVDEGPELDAFGKRAVVQAFPIGIDVENLKELVPGEGSKKVLDEVRAEAGKRMLMVGVDRLDYTKDVPGRLKAFRKLLEDQPHLRNRVTMVQIAAPTRGAVPAYARLSRKTKKLVDEINAQFGTGEWQPVMYKNEPVDRSALPEIYRLSQVGVVTPVADGMNLVAKEYIAAQHPENPGVLVLSTGAGAAAQLSQSILVPPKDKGAMAKAYARALTMPLDERQRRHAELFENVEQQDLPWWRQNYLAALAKNQLAASAGEDSPEHESTSSTSSSGHRAESGARG